MRRDSTRAAEFVAYVDARRSHLRRTAYLICGDWHAADDLVQIALIKLYVAWPRIRNRGAEDSYARQIIVRAHVDEKRRPWHRERPGLEGFDVPAPTGVAIEESDALLTALRQLPTRQRAAVVLRFWCGLSVAEAATELGCSPGTVKSNTARALAKLRNSLITEEEMENDRGPAAASVQHTDT